MRTAYRVAAPRIRFVPWTALASCWPLPQQLLSVFPLLPPAVTSSPGAGEVFAHWRRSSSLHFAHNQRKDYFKFCISETTAVVSEMLFHGKGSYRETASLPKGVKTAGRTPSVKPCGFATSLWEGGDPLRHRCAMPAPPRGGGYLLQTVRCLKAPPLGGAGTP